MWLSCDLKSDYAIRIPHLNVSSMHSLNATCHSARTIAGPGWSMHWLSVCMTRLSYSIMVGQITGSQLVHIPSLWLSLLKDINFEVFREYGYILFTLWYSLKWYIMLYKSWTILARCQNCNMQQRYLLLDAQLYACKNVTQPNYNNLTIISDQGISRNS